MPNTLARWLLGLLLLPAWSFAATLPIGETSIPSELKEWRAWVLKGHEYHACPFISTSDITTELDSSNYICAWPGKLMINADAKGATFNQHWRVDAPAWVMLPGDEENWPQELTVNGQRYPVLTFNDEPALRLEPGNYDIRARIFWSERPQVLHVPESVGLIELNVDGKTIAPLERDGESLTLGRASSSTPDAESLALKVFRKISDGLPALLDTKIELDVAGPGREEILGPILPQGYVPTAITGDLPARLDPNGMLHIQLRPGSWTLDVLARAQAPLIKLTAIYAPAPWPTQEIWSYAATPSLRITNASSAVSIDPAQAGVPSEWRTLPAFAMQQDNVFTIEERTRGVANTDANRLRLNREAWLDFSGDGLFAKDRINGQMIRSWRLDMGAPYALMRAESDGEGLLITRGIEMGTNGVELRNPNVNLFAGVRVDTTTAALPINGWRQTFDSVSLSLHLPYGYRLLGAPGADHAAGTWIERWTLLDVFIIAVLVLLAWRLLGMLGGMAVALYLLLSYQEPGVPLWTLGAVLVFELIRKALPMGRLARASDGLARFSLVILMLVALPFAADQIRFSLYPQLERSSSTYNRLSGMMDFRNTDSQKGDGIAEENIADKLVVNAAPFDAKKQYGNEKDTEQMDATSPMPPPPLINSGGVRTKLPGKPQLQKQEMTIPQSSSGFGINNEIRKMKRYAENTNVQAGRGEPGWQYGSTYSLSWQGPVLPEQSVHLIIVTPFVVSSLRVLLVALLAFIALQLSRRSFARNKPGTGSSRMKGVIGVLLIASHVLVSQSVKAEPSQEMLNELRTRLIEAPHCAPSCANLALAQVRAQGDNIQIALEAQVGERLVLPLPSEEKNLVLKSIMVDGIAQDGLLRKDEQLWITLARGVHRIELSFSVLATDKISLPFPLKPARIEFIGSGWEASGLSEDHLLTETLDLVRLRETGAEPARGTTQQFPPYVALTRNLRLDLDWQIENLVQRLAPAEGGFSVDLALLKNEHVTSAQLKVKNGHITVPLPTGVVSANWSSQLEKSEDITSDKSETITLTAPPIVEHAEVWKIIISPSWHAEFSGLPAVQAQAEGNYWVHEFHPLPGETLTIKITRPDAIVGSSEAIDAVGLTSQIGTRAAEHHLTLSLRSTQGGEHVIELPKAAEVLSVSKDGQSLNLRPRDGALSLPLTPGTQGFDIRWRENHALGIRVDTPLIKLNSPAANINTQIDMPNDRWILRTMGPVVGPAVLYWGELAVMILLAIGLSRLRRTPLKFRHWLLLGLGFSTFSWGALLIVLLWLLALDWRERHPIQRNAVFNLAQIALLLLTLGALVCLVSAIPFGLLGEPNMHLTGNGSVSTTLRWFADQSSDNLPVASVISLPLWAYKLAMLAWALWLANALIGWLRWGFSAWSQGNYWRSTPKKPKLDVALAGNSSTEKHEG